MVNPYREGSKGVHVSTLSRNMMLSRACQASPRPEEEEEEGKEGSKGRKGGREKSRENEEKKRRK